MSKQIDRGLIVKYLNNSCTSEERILVEQFLRLPESESLLNEILSDQSPQDWAAFRQDEAKHEEFSHWKETIHKKIGVSISSKPESRLKGPFYLQYAAIWISFVMGFAAYGFWQYQKRKPQPIAYIENSNPNGQRSTIKLADGSVVYLGAGSHLKYPERFAGNTREISLVGEAFFEVTKNPKKPFIIHTGDVTTKVLGTSFKIDAFKSQPISVEVATGKVRVDQHLGNHQVKSLAILTPGQKVIWNHDNAETSKIAIADITMWKESRLAFNNRSLREIADKLERWYNLTVSFKNHAKSTERMTVTLNASVPADKILKVLANAGHFKYTIKDRSIIIK